jgi:chromosome segregation ATPase
VKTNYPILYILLILIFISGCSTVSNDKIKDVEHKVNEIHVLTQDLQERIDELSMSISLVVNDSNELHNEIDNHRAKTIQGLSAKNKASQQRLEEAEVFIKGLHDQVSNLGNNYKVLEEGLNKRIDEIQKAEVELSNRLEMIKLDIKDKVRENITPVQGSTDK